MFMGSVPALAQGRALTQSIQEHEQAALFPSAGMLEMGQAMAETACARCHGMDGMGTEAGLPHLAGQRVIYLYRVLRVYQNDDRGNESMRHVSHILNEEAMLAVAAYYASLVPARDPDTGEQPNQPESLEESPFAEISEALGKCTKCHGENGNDSASGMPNLTAQHPDYFVASMQSYADGGRDHKLMKRLVGALDPSTIAQMGVYFAVQDPLGTKTLGEGDVEAGRIGAQDCANCHGPDGNAGGKDVPTIAGQDARYFVKAMEAYRSGEREHERMREAVEPLSDTDVVNLATFYAVQQPVQRDVRRPLSSAEWLERCQRCHGFEGNSTDPRFPMLAGQDRTYLRKAMDAYTRGDRSGSIMHAMSNPLSPLDLEQIVNYFATREPKSVVYVQAPCEGSGPQ